MGRATYTDADKAKVYVVLTTNDGNVKRTARETGVPENTVRRWKKWFEDNGPPNLEEVEAQAGDFVATANEVRFLAIESMVQKHYDGPTLPTMSTGATDMAYLRAKGIQCYGIGPAVDEEDGPKGFGAHSDQERILESELHRFVRFNWDLVVELARADPTTPLVMSSSLGDDFPGPGGSLRRRWKHGMKELRSHPGQLRLSPDDWAAYRFGDGVSAFDLAAAVWEERRTGVSR